jgi:cytochrome c oxidase subunit 4
MAHAHTIDHTVPAAFNELDPHGSGGHGHGDGHGGHKIVGPGIILTVLLFLLMFTALTVGLAQLEIAIASWLNITLPWWVNVLVAMSIATVKSVMVMAYFMQLKYDNPINSVAMVFCFAALGLFLLFTGLDLFSRGNINEAKAGPVMAGGTSKGIVGANNQPVVLASKVRLKEQLGENDIKEWVILGMSLEHAATGLQSKGSDEAAAAKVLMAKAKQMLDLHTVKLHPPSGPSQVMIAAEVEALAASLRGAGKPAAADLVSATSRQIGSLDMAAAKASYSIEEAFAAMAHIAHGDGHGAHGSHEVSNSGNYSRTRTGMSGVIPGSGNGHGNHGGHGEGHATDAAPAKH